VVADDDWFGLGTASREFAVGTFPGHLDVDPFPVAEVLMVLVLIDEGAGYADLQGPFAPRVGGPGRIARCGAFVFADRGREEGHFDRALAREPLDLDRRQMAGAKVTVGRDPHRVSPAPSPGRGAHGAGEADHENKAGGESDPKIRLGGPYMNTWAYLSGTSD
jgi:hypothetical protein